MAKPKPNIARRIKRRVWAPSHDLFAVTALGLEELCADELRSLSMAEVGPLAGGVAFSGGIEDIYRANLWLRTAGRVLMRLTDFRVRGWHDLSRQASKIPWEVFLAPGAEAAVGVTLKNSNLKHSGRIAEEVLNQAAKHMKSLGLDPPRPAKADNPGAQKIMVRAVDRRAMISIDTSGGHLHKRGYRKASGPAPLREDLAAGLLALCGYQPQEPLLDAMCGAGTLAIEASLMARSLPPAMHRELAIMNWPAHRGPAYEHLRKQAAAAAQDAAPAPIMARDRSANTLRAAEANARRAGVQTDLMIEKADFFSADPPDTPPGLVVINPPYGKRLGNIEQAESFHRRIGRRLRDCYPGWRVGIVLYRGAWAGLLGLQEQARLSVPHGGLRVTMLHGLVPAK